MAERKYKIAVTGGIGSGKSEFCNFIKKKGYPVRITFTAEGNLRF